MPTYSAASKNQADGYDKAADRLHQLADSMLAQVEVLALRASRGGTVWSLAEDVAAVHERCGLMKSYRDLMKTVKSHRDQALAFRRGPCPACSRAQRGHCPGCGACVAIQTSSGVGHIRNDCPVLTGELVTSM